MRSPSMRRARRKSIEQKSAGGRKLRFGGHRLPPKKRTGRTFGSGRLFRSDRRFDQGMSPATNFGMTGPPISAAKRRPDGVKKNNRPPIWLSVS